MKITTKLLTLMFFLLALTVGASAQIIAPTGITTRASSQLVYYYDLTGGTSTDIQVTNTNETEGVTVHVQIFRSYNTGSSSEPVLTICDERDFVDFLTPTDTHVYDLSEPGFEKNTGEAEDQAGESTSVDLTSPVPTKGFVVITPVVSESDLSAISFQYLTGTSNDDARDFIINAMGRDAVNFTTGEVVPDGTPLDGTTNGFVQIQPEELIFDFQSSGSPVDVVGIAFHDEYGDPGLLGYQVTPGEVSWTPFIFDYKEAVTSCGERTIGCFDSTGLNDNVPHNNTAFNGNDLLCAGATSPTQPGIGFSSGWTRIFITGIDDLENHMGVFYSVEERGADFMHAKGERTEIDPGPVEEVCDDEAMADEDEDGFANCLDTDCATAENCETGVDECTNGTDDDEDGAADCADLGCDGTVIDSESGAVCETGGETSCNDGFDNDGDGDVDGADSDCQTADTGGTTGDDGGDGGGCTVATSVTTATAAANFLLPLLPLAGAYGFRRLRQGVHRS